MSYIEFVVQDGGPGVKGFSVDVFKAAINLLPYPVSYKFFNIWRWFEESKLQ
jgi:glutamate receptor, ionotropic, plant